MKEKYKYAIICQALAFVLLAIGCLAHFTISDEWGMAKATLVVGSILYFCMFTLFGTIPCLVFGFDKNPGGIV